MAGVLFCDLTTVRWFLALGGRTHRPDEKSSLKISVYIYTQIMWTIVFLRKTVNSMIFIVAFLDIIIVILPCSLIF